MGEDQKMSLTCIFWTLVVELRIFGFFSAFLVSLALYCFTLPSFNGMQLGDEGSVLGVTEGECHFFTRPPLGSIRAF
jgi:hypothetical protein